MKGSQFSHAQKGFILKQGADGVPAAESAGGPGSVRRRTSSGISQGTYFIWKEKYDGLLPTEMKRLKQLEGENGPLRKLLSDLSLDRKMLQEVIRRKI